MTTIVIDGLSAKSLANAAKAVDRYAKQFNIKHAEFVRELTKAGIQVMYDNLYGYGDSEPPQPQDNPRVYVGVKGGVLSATLRLRGEDVAFVEFGAGVHYNGTGSPHPLGVELGYTIGSYGHGQGTQDHWWYEDENGITVISYGTEATMPMYKADQHIRNNFVDIAKRVFGG